MGVHRCLGVRLALTEATIAVEELVAELPPVTAVESVPPMLDLLSFQAPRRVLVERVATERPRLGSISCQHPVQPVGLPPRLTTLGRTLVMAVLNVTPDSFSDGGRFLDIDAAVERGQTAVRSSALT